MQNTIQDTTNSTQRIVEPHRAKATERQINAIAYHLWQAGYNDNHHYIKEIMTKYEASDILGSLMMHDYEMGIKQLEHFADSYK